MVRRSQRTSYDLTHLYEIGRNVRSNGYLDNFINQNSQLVHDPNIRPFLRDDMVNPQINHSAEAGKNSSSSENDNSSYNHHINQNHHHLNNHHNLTNGDILNNANNLNNGNNLPNGHNFNNGHNLNIGLNNTNNLNNGHIYHDHANLKTETANSEKTISPFEEFIRRLKLNSESKNTQNSQNSQNTQNLPNLPNLQNAPNSQISNLVNNSQISLTQNSQINNSATNSQNLYIPTQPKTDNKIDNASIFKNFIENTLNERNSQVNNNFNDNFSNFNNSQILPTGQNLSDLNKEEKVQILNPTCPQHSQQVNTPFNTLSFVPSSVSKRLLSKSSIDSDSTVDPWQKMKSAHNHTMVDNLASKSKIVNFKPTHCEIHGTPIAHDHNVPAGQNPQIFQNAPSGQVNQNGPHQIDPKILMILKKLKKSSIHEPQRCFYHQNSFDYSYHQPYMPEDRALSSYKMQNNSFHFS